MCSQQEAVVTPDGLLRLCTGGKNIKHILQFLVTRSDNFSFTLPNISIWEQDIGKFGQLKVYFSCPRGLHNVMSPFTAFQRNKFVSGLWIIKH